MCEKADLAIVSSYPSDLDLWQATKALCAAEHAVKDGGEIVLVTPCYEGIGPHKDLDVLINQGKDNPEELLKQSYENQVSDPLAASGAIHLGKVIAKNKTISLVCPNISFKQAGQMGWRKYNSVAEVISIALKRNKNVKINIITHGGYLCPIYENR